TAATVVVSLPNDITEFLLYQGFDPGIPSKLDGTGIHLLLQNNRATIEWLDLGGFLHHGERENGSGQHQQHFGKSLFLLDVQLIGLHVVTVRYRNRNGLKDNCASNLSLQKGPPGTGMRTGSRPEAKP